MRDQSVQTVFLRLALSVAFLSAVADRLGLWGKPGAPLVAWGDMRHFASYVAAINPWFPNSWISAVSWVATLAESALGFLLMVGLKTRWAARLSGLLLLSFAFGMTVGTGFKTALDASVLTASAGAFLLATARRYAWSVDDYIESEKGEPQTGR